MVNMFSINNLLNAVLHKVRRHMDASGPGKWVAATPGTGFQINCQMGQLRSIGKELKAKRQSEVRRCSELSLTARKKSPTFAPLSSEWGPHRGLWMDFFRSGNTAKLQVAVWLKTLQAQWHTYPFLPHWHLTCCYPKCLGFYSIDPNSRIRLSTARRLDTSPGTP